MTPLLEIRNLTVDFTTGKRAARVIDGLSLSLQPGEILAIVGESGSGKSVTALSVMGLLPAQAALGAQSQILFNGLDLRTLSAAQMRALRGKDIAMIFQDPMSSLDPCYTIGEQIIETLRAHRSISRADAFQEALALLKQVRLTEPERRMKQYPHELSGGMCQRVMIAMALCTKPRLLIADEPTTAVDVTIQAQILALLRELNETLGIGIIMITHDLGVVAELCHRVLVMYAGACVEYSDVDTLFTAPAHPYTLGLMNSRPTLTRLGQPLTPIEGNPPDLFRRLPGCQFAARCTYAVAECRQSAPTLVSPTHGHQVACFLVEEKHP
ncbi:ABC transporter ATP-binding protein [Musicola paradisiaca]|uniref:Oligopeptide/dipeptide ABC transporter, ATPase subunit n=1 Tax=Musicola paradisiaca (strain Ech703) TaxID=579405 RepID=C6C7F8_MUSP7|nr:ABC transporter ATP-binding protein [Musicola paradisiaca]ACS84076.1 oligopeptide/dipeptide ABC transporter, ATPase subunit [Musicola paradisiaca Ech703]